MYYSGKMIFDFLKMLDFLDDGFGSVRGGERIITLKGKYYFWGF